jgi:hypothetical protein
MKKSILSKDQNLTKAEQAKLRKLLEEIKDKKLICRKLISFKQQVFS